MPGAWRTVRVFVSSTFRDMHAERDHLARVAFPRVRAWCERRRLHFTDIDLRWGVSREQVEDGRAIEACLGEIDGSRPFFVCLLGERYGWVPPEPPPESPFRLPKDGAALSITHLEILHATLESFAREERLRRPRCAYGFFYLRDPACLPDEGLIPAAARKEFRSAFLEERPERVLSLARLKDWIRDRFPDRAFEYSGVWDHGAENPENPSLIGRLAGLDALGERVEKDLISAISEEFREHILSSEAPGPVEEERALHEAFIELRTRVHVPRLDAASRLTGYAQGDEPRPLALTGAPGSGKSAVLAHWIRERSSGGTPVIARFIGASPASTDLHGLLAGLCAELRELIAPPGKDAGRDAQEGGDRLEIPVEAEALRREFPRFLEAAGARGAVLLVLDGLDQLVPSPEALRLDWLPARLPPGVRLIVSAADSARTGADWSAGLERLKIPRLRLAPLSDEERRRILRELPSLFCKTLGEESAGRLLDNAATRNPLFLVVALEELRTFGSFEQLPRKIASLPRVDDSAGAGDAERAVEELFSVVLERLERENQRAAPGLAAALLRLLGSARAGLSRGELSGLLALELPEIPERAREEACERVLRLLRPYLLQKGPLLAFFHKSLELAVRRRHLARPPERRRTFGRIAEFFAGQPDASPEGAPNERKAFELPWQLLRAARESESGSEEWKALARLLTDIRFVESKCRARQLFDLQEDYRATLAQWPDYLRYDPFESAGAPPPADGTGDASRVEAFAAFVSSSAHWLANCPDETIPLARNHAEGGPVADAAGRAAESLSKVWFAREPRPKPPPPRPACFRTIHAKPEWDAGALALAADGRTALTAGFEGISVWDLRTGDRVKILGRAGGSARRVAATPDGRIAVSVDDSFSAEPAAGRILVWDIPTGELLRAVCPDAPRGPLALTPDGRLAAAASRSTAVWLWDIETGERAAAFDAGLETGALALSPDGRLLLTAHDSPGIGVWEPRTGRRLALLEGHGGEVRGVALSEDGKVAVSAGTDHTLRIWDVGSARCLRVLGRPFNEDPSLGHTSVVNGVALTPDGRLALSASGDHSLRLWDTASGDCLRVLRGHGNHALGARLSPDGRIGASIAEDMTLRVWDLAEGLSPEPPPGHEYPVRDLAVSLDGSTAVSAGSDSTVRVWDARSGRHRRALLGHASPVMEVELEPEGRCLSSGTDGSLRRWDLRTGECELAMRGPAAPGPRRSVGIYSLLVAAGGDLAVSAGDAADRNAPDTAIRAWHLPSGVCLASLEGHGDYVTALAPVAQGPLLLSASDDHTLRLWNIGTGACLRVIKHPEGDLHAAAVTPDGKIAVSASGGTVRVWELGSGTCLREFFGGTDRKGGLALTPDGRKILCGGSAAKLFVWELESGRELHELRGHSAGLRGGLAVTPDGRAAVSGSRDQTLRLWDLADGRCLAVYPAGAWISALSGVRPDGRLVCGGWDGQLHFLSLRGLALSEPIVTAGRVWRADAAKDLLTIAGIPIAGERFEGHYEEAPSVLCPACGRRSPAPAPALDAIAGIARDCGLAPEDSPCLKLPAPAWEEARLRQICPRCGATLRFNPFLAS